VFEQDKNCLLLNKNNINKNLVNTSLRKSTSFVTPILLGGLGNQMFEMANAYAYAKNNNMSLIVNKTSNMKNKSYWDSIFKDIQTDIKCESYKWKKLTEKNFHYQPLPTFKSNVNIKLDGYFQSAKYFNLFKQDLITLFTKHIDIDLSIEKQSTESQLVSVHVRRGDYLKYKLHTNVGQYYLEKAMSTIESKIGTNIEYVVFSDDLPWCKNNFNTFFPTRVFHYCSKGQDYEQMFLMSLCDHNIIANSSFSWWGAWMNNKSSQIVTAPSNWFTGSNKNWQDIYCENWIIL
jgi:hypothetical protein